MFKVTVKNLDTRKLAESLYNLAHSKPGFDLNDYDSNASYQRDYRYYYTFAKKNRRRSVGDIHELLEDANKERLCQVLNDKRIHVYNEQMDVEYITGQYYPIEYQEALYDFLEHVWVLGTPSVKNEIHTGV